MESLIYWNHPVTAKDNTINGTGLVFYDGTDSTRNQIGKDTYEALLPKVQIKYHRDDVLCCFNHDFSKPLARLKNKTLTLSTNHQGITYSAKLNQKNPNHVALYEDVVADLITGSSATFKPLKYTWIEEGEKDILLYTEIELVEIGPVTLPAMTAATVAASEQETQQFHKQVLETRKRFLQLHKYQSPKGQNNQPKG